MINIFQYQMLGLNSKDLQNEYVSSSFCISSETEHDTPSGILSELQNSLHLHQKATLLHEIENLKQQHIRQIQSLKLSQHLLESTHSFNMQQMMIKYDETIYERDCLKTQNKQLRDQITKINNELNKHKSIVGKYEEKIKNQQGLIDQYKRSIEEQIGLQKQVIRVEYMERQLANKIQFQKALRCMQQNYQRKVEQQKYQSTYKEYKVDMNSMKKLCSTLTRKSKTSTNNSGQKQKQNRMDVYDTKCHNGARLSQVNPRQMKNSSSYSTIEK